MKPAMQLVIVLAIIFSIDVCAQERELTKEINFHSEVTKIEQKYDYWCVYAALEVVGDFMSDDGEQCNFCDDLLRRRIKPDYENGINPYSYIDFSDYMDVMEDYVNGDSSPCDNSADYKEFGVPGSYFLNYVRDYSIYRMPTTDFIKALSDVNVSLSAPVLLISKDDDNYGHVYVFLASYYYDNDWEAGGSSIELWDVGLGEEKTYSLRKLNDEISSVFKVK